MKTRSGFRLFLLSCWFVQPLVAVETLSVSLLQLSANPKDYDGKVVCVIGFVRLEFQGNSIYLHHDDYQQAITKVGLWIDGRDDIRKKQKDYDQRHVLSWGRQAFSRALYRRTIYNLFTNF